MDDELGAHGRRRLQYAACKVEAQPDMSEPGHAPPFMPNQGPQIEEKFLAFLRGYKVNGHQFYKIMSSALASINVGEMNIQYAHLQQFDPILANTIHIFFESVQTNLANAAKVFLKEEVGFQCENPVVKISDRPMPCSYMPLKDFWSLPEHRPSEECDIYCGEMVLNITKTTLDGRIVLLNLLRKIFGSFEKGNSWNGDWTITGVMVCLKTYQVEIIKPFCKHCNYSTMTQDILVVSTNIIPEFKCGGRLPAFFAHLESSLRKFIVESDLNALTWKKFRGFVTSHFALKPPLTRSKFLDNLHEMCPGAKKLLQIILSNRSLATDWRLFLKDEDVVNPILAFVYELNRKHKEEMAQERKTTKDDKNRVAGKEDNTIEVLQTNVPADFEHTFDADAGMQAHAVGVMQTNDAELEDINAGVVQTLVAPFDGTLEGLLIFSRYIKKHASKGAKDNKGEQKLQELSEIDLVISHYLEMLPEILKALIYNIDSEHLKYNADDYDKFLMIFQEIFEVYNAPEVVPNSEAERETFPFLAS